MDDQATVRQGEGTRPNGQPEGVVGGIAEFGNDIATLAELQFKLAMLDFSESAGRATLPLVLTLAGLAVLVASMPVALIGMAELLSAALSIPRGWALLLIAVLAMAGAAVVTVLAGLRFSRSFESFQ